MKPVAEVGMTAQNWITPTTHPSAANAIACVHRRLNGKKYAASIFPG